MELRTRPNPYGWPCEDDGLRPQSLHSQSRPSIQRDHPPLKKFDITNMKTTCTIFASKKKLYRGGAAGPGAFKNLALPKKGVGTNPCKDFVCRFDKVFKGQPKMIMAP